MISKAKEVLEKVIELDFLNDSAHNLLGEFYKTLGS
jgi:vacuolar-type H+-ATPase subunit D/Vma8